MTRGFLMVTVLAVMGRSLCTPRERRPLTLVPRDFRAYERARRDHRMREGLAAREFAG